MRILVVQTTLYEYFHSLTSTNIENEPDWKSIMSLNRQLDTVCITRKFLKHLGIEAIRTRERTWV